MRPVYVGERVTFESYGNAEQKLYVRSDRLATERRGLEHEFGKGTYWDRPSPRETGCDADEYAEPNSTAYHQHRACDAGEEAQCLQCS